MTAKNDRFWAKVLFREFIKHYRKMTDEQIVRDVRQSMDDLDDLVDDTDTFGSKMVRWSVVRAEQYPMASENGKKGGRPRKKKETTADAPTSDDGEFKSDSGDAGNLESATSANIYGDAATREGAEAFACRESGVVAPTTVSNISQDAPNGNAGDERRSGSNSVATVSLVHPAPNMRRVPQNEAPAHGFSGGRTAQGTMSRSPEAAAQSGKVYDKETDQVSTNGPRQAEDRQSQGRTGAPSTGATSSTAPVRSYRPRKVPHPKGEYEVFDFASENGIPEWVANEFYQRFFVERDGTDTEGNNIDNWKGALINYSKSRKRETA